MNLPALDSEGNLPVGVHASTLSELITVFGALSAQRMVVAGRLQRLYAIAQSTGHLKRFVVFGSFITAKLDPNDVDIVMIMHDTFDLNQFSGDVAIMFDHAAAQVHFGASVFWSRSFSAFGGEQAMIEHWMIRRDGGFRGIVEISGE